MKRHLSIKPLLSSRPATIFRKFAGQLVRPHLDPADGNVMIVEDTRFSFPTDAPVGL